MTAQQLNNETRTPDLQLYLCSLSKAQLETLKQEHSLAVNADADYSQFAIAGDD